MLSIQMHVCSLKQQHVRGGCVLFVRVCLLIASLTACVPAHCVL